MSRLISLFRSLTPQEVKKFGQFFQSPYYNATPKMRALYKYLKKTYPDCPFEVEDKQTLFIKIFEGEAYNTRKMNNLTASLSSILQDFLLLEHMKKGGAVRRQILSDIYKERQLSKLSIQQLSAQEKRIREQPKPFTFRYYEALKLYHELYFHFETKRTKSRKGQDYEYLKAALTNLRLFYTHLWLRFICEMNFREGSSTEEFKLKEEEEGYIERLIHQYDVPLLEIYLLLYKILRQADDDAYERLEKITLNYIDNYNSTEVNFLLTFITNYKVISLRKGNKNALPELFVLYQYGLDKNIYLSETKHFPISHFVNIAVTASELGETDWLAEFLEQYKMTLKESDRENTLRLCHAYLHFGKQEYKDTILLASQVKHAALLYALTCWTLEIRAYYMMQGEYEYWGNILKNFRAYLNRRKDIAEKTKAANSNFVTLMRELYRAKYLKIYTREELLARLKKKKNIVCKRWLEKQIQGLK